MISSSKLSSRSAAFTLIELMVSIAIVVVLMVGVAQVFQYTGQAVGANQQMSDAVRNDRAIQSTLTNDFTGIAADGPFLQFRSSVRTAYRNQADESADKDGNVYTWDPVSVGTETRIPAAQVNERNHRVDTFSMFARGNYPRQTGGGRLASSPGAIGSSNPFVASQSGNEAWIWLGHLILPNNGAYGPEATTGNQQFPNDPFDYDPSGGGSGNPLGKSVNPNNYYSTQWILGRVQMLLVEPTAPTPALSGAFPNGYIVDRNGNLQDFVFRFVPTTPTQKLAMLSTLSPLVQNSNATSGATTDRLQRCRYDLAGTSIAGYRQILNDYIGTPWASGVNYLKDQRVRFQGISYIAKVDNSAQPTVGGDSNWGVDDDWWTNTMGGKRFNCNPFVIRPLDAATYSQQFPVFSQGCTQLIVEYAGDFLSQVTDPSSKFYGRVVDVFDNPVPNVSHTDGQTDFFLTWTDANGNNQIDSAAERESIRREIRWYGMPRDVRGNGTIPGYAANRYQHNLFNVVPLRDVVRTIASSGIAPPTGWQPAGFTGDITTYADYPGAPFEKFYTSIGSIRGSGIWFNNPTLRQLAEYYGITQANNMWADESYQCAWGPNDKVRPQYIRITITLDDPNSRFAEGQTFQYVFKLP